MRVDPRLSDSFHALALCVLSSCSPTGVPRSEIHDLSDFIFDGTIGLFFSAATASPKDMSVLSIGNFIRVTPHVLVVTLTVWFKDDKITPEPSAPRTDKVFGPNPIAVCFVMCTC